MESAQKNVMVKKEKNNYERYFTALRERNLNTFKKYQKNRVCLEREKFISVCARLM